VSDQEQGQAIGSLQSLQALGSVIGPAFAGVLFDRLGMSSPFWLGALLLLVSLGLLLVWHQPPARSTVVP
jgi:predicted MFS family arabinose efflux permease